MCRFIGMPATSFGGHNSWLTGWIDWNMVLDFQGGPSHKSNWCVAPVLADPKTDAVYYTPLYYVMAISANSYGPGPSDGLDSACKELMAVACKNADGSIALVVLNQGDQPVSFSGGIREAVFPGDDTSPGDSDLGDSVILDYVGDSP